MRWGQEAQRATLLAPYIKVSGLGGGVEKGEKDRKMGGRETADVSNMYLFET